MRTFFFVLFFSIFSAAIAQTTVFFDDFENGDLGSAWTPRPNLNGENGFVGVQNGVGLNGSFGLSIGKSFNANQLTTSAIDLNLNLSGQTDLELRFAIVDFAEENQPDDGLYFSDDGGATFVPILRFYGAEWCDFVYGEFPPIDVDALAAENGLSLSSNFVIRWQQRGVNSFNAGNPDGIRIDNVSLVSRPIEYASIDFFADFNDNSFGSNSWAWRFADQTTALNLATQPSSPMNAVGVGLNDGINNTPGVFMGRRCAGPVTTTALDLHLNLAGEDNVTLAFWIYDFNDLTQIDDGIYFSNDGGENFSKAVDFLPNDWCDFLYGYYVPIDVAELAASLDLPLTDRFIIRFQRAGGEPFNAGDPGGFLLDDVNVFRENDTYATLPFTDNFDDGTFKAAWVWNAADLTADLNLPNDPSGPHNAVGININSGNNGTPGVFIGRDCAGPITTNALDLNLNLAGKEQVALNFDLYDNNDLTQETDGLYFSDDGGDSFVKVLDFVPNEYCDFLYSPFPTVDVDALAAANGLDLTNRFVIRFQQSDSRPFNAGDPAGFLLDNVSVTEVPIVYAAVPFTDFFDDQSFMPGWRPGDPTNSSALDLDNAIQGLNNIVGIGPQSGLNGTPGIFMGRNCAGPLTVNALDLYVNMAFQTAATLDFWLYDNNDLTHIDDGIYFSDDGGATFVKAVDFNPNAYPDFSYFEFPTVNITALATSLGLSMSPTFVIRFQQADTRPFNAGDPGGFLIDQVVINGAPSSSNNPAADAHKLIAYPNPVNDRLRLNRSLSGTTAYQLIDANGRILRSGQWVPAMDISMLQAGVYALRLNDPLAKKTYSLRFVKQ